MTAIAFARTHLLEGSLQAVTSTADLPQSDPGSGPSEAMTQDIGETVKMIHECVKAAQAVWPMIQWATKRWPRRRVPRHRKHRPKDPK